MTIPYELLNYS